MALSNFSFFVVTLLAVASARRLFSKENDNSGNVGDLAMESDSIEDSRIVPVHHCDVVVGGISRSKGGKALARVKRLTRVGNVLNRMKRFVPAGGHHKWKVHTDRKAGLCRCPKGWIIDGRSSVCSTAAWERQSIYNFERFVGHECFCRPDVPRVAKQCDEEIGEITLGISYNRKSTIAAALRAAGFNGKKHALIKHAVQNRFIADKVGTDHASITGKLLDELPAMVLRGLQAKWFVVESSPSDLRQSTASNNTGMMLMKLKVCGLSDKKRFFQCNIGAYTSWFGKESLLGQAASTMFSGVADIATDIAQLQDVIIESIRTTLPAQVMDGLHGKVGSPNVCIFDSGLIVTGPDGKPFDSSSDVRYLPRKKRGEAPYPPSKFEQLLDPTVCPQVMWEPLPPLPKEAQETCGQPGVVDPSLERKKDEEDELSEWFEPGMDFTKEDDDDDGDDDDEYDEYESEEEEEDEEENSPGWFGRMASNSLETSPSTSGEYMEAVYDAY